MAYGKREDPNTPRKAFQARFTDPLKEKLDAGASASNQSLNAFITSLLSTSITTMPSLQIPPEVDDQVNPQPFSLRLPASVKAQIQDAGRRFGRSLNTEILMRLTLALQKGHDLSRLNSEDASELNCKLAWQRLSAAIESTLRSDLLEMPQAIKELSAAKAEYQKLMVC